VKIGLIADSHDNVPMIRSAVNAFLEAGVGAIIHAGDIVSPFAAKELLTATVPIRAVYGNNDGDTERLAEMIEGIRPGPWKFKLAGKNFLLTHDSEPVSEADLEGVDIFVYGHSHIYHFEPGPPIHVNPGEAGGWLTGIPTVALLDTKTMKITRVMLSQDAPVDAS
jgi:putative phosphoesterase